MISCPICGVYWDYLKDLPKGIKNYLPLRIKYQLKEQGDCIAHVAGDHSTMILIEQLSNEIKDLRNVINTTILNR